jgi:hypothetical protein
MLCEDCKSASAGHKPPQSWVFAATTVKISADTQDALLKYSRAGADHRPYPGGAREFESVSLQR